jgi:hypothetical protein
VRHLSLIEAKAYVLAASPSQDACVEEAVSARILQAIEPTAIDAAIENVASA